MVLGYRFVLDFQEYQDCQLARLNLVDRLYQGYLVLQGFQGSLWGLQHLEYQGHPVFQVFRTHPAGPQHLVHQDFQLVLCCPKTHSLQGFREFQDCPQDQEVQKHLVYPVFLDFLEYLLIQLVQLVLERQGNRQHH